MKHFRLGTRSPRSSGFTIRDPAPQGTCFNTHQGHDQRNRLTLPGAKVTDAGRSGTIRGTDYDLVGFSITPSKSLTRTDREDLDRDILSLLASLAFPPPGVSRVAFDLRYLTLNDASLAGKHLLVTLLCRLDFEHDSAEPKVIAERFAGQFHELLSLHLDSYDFRIRQIPPGDIWSCLQPFKPTDYVELHRRVLKLRPLRMSKFQGRSSMSRTVDMLLRQRAQMCLSVYLEPHPMSEDESRELELFGYETDVLSTVDRELRDLKELFNEPGFSNAGSTTPFRVAVRIASDEPISQYVVNLLGAEISGNGDYTFYRPAPDQMDDTIDALADLHFRSIGGDIPGNPLPESLRNLRHIFSASEALAGFRLPTERIATSKERVFRTYDAPVANLPDSGLQLGIAEHPSYPDSLPVYLKPPDRRRHVYVVGKTGTGKSMLLLNMISQDIREDRGVCVIDPHGDLIAATLAHIPDRRANQVILFDPADPEFVAGMNFLEPTSTDTDAERDFLIQEVLSMILRMVEYNFEMFGPIAQQMTRMACRTLMASDMGGTLVEVPRIFANNAFRAKVLSSVRDPEITRWWKDEWDRKNEYQKNEVLGYFTSKFEQFVSAPSVRNVVGQSRSTFDFKQVMDEGKILLVNLSRGRLGAMNSAALGGMVVSKMLWAATRRAWEPEETRRDFYLYVDGFQNFVSDSFDTILSEARKYRLSLIMAHQHLGQLHAMGRLGDRVERAVFGNAGTLLAFRVGTDAPRLADELGSPVDAGTLRSLENRYAVAQLLVDDVPTMPFTMRTADYSVPEVADQSRISDLVQAARHRNTPVSEIERAMRARWDTPPPEASTSPFGTR